MVSKGSYKPTQEQATIMRDALVRKDDGRKVEAFAGTGKTSTLVMLANERKEPGIYLAFNKAISMDAQKKFPKHIKVTTAHAAAYAAMSMFKQRERLEKRIFGNTVKDLIRLPLCSMSKDVLGQIVLDTLGRFFNSAERVISLDHVALDPREPEDVRIAAMEGAQALWLRMSNINDTCPITHDTYLKMWQLGDARLNGLEWAMFDEAQDASPVMIDIMLRQGIPITWVGDKNQAIYAFRGAVNAMSMMPGDAFPLTQSFRFGEVIAVAANAILLQKPESYRPNHQLRGNPERNSQVGRMPKQEKHAFLSRTNSEWFQEALKFRESVHVVGGLEETARLLEGAYGLWRQGMRATRVPTIARFPQWKDLCEHAEKFEDRELMFARRIVEQYRENLPREIQGLRERHVESEEDAKLILSTAHKAKGKEFSHVRLGSGFLSPLDEKWKLTSASEQEAELNLLYVAATRAIEGLDPNQAVLDCIALTKGQINSNKANRNQERLPDIQIRNPIPLQDGLQSSVQGQHLNRQLPISIKHDSSSAFRPWTSEEDQQTLTMITQGFIVDDIASWLGRNSAAVAVRLSVLGAPGSSPTLQAEVLAALVPVYQTPMLQAEPKKINKAGASRPKSGTPSPTQRRSPVPYQGEPQSLDSHPSDDPYMSEKSNYSFR
jgi:F-box protein, helicase, 18